MTKNEIIMTENRIINVKISKPKLHIEDHGFLTFDFIINGSGFGCCFGGYKIGGKYGDGSYDACDSGLIAIMKIMDVVGVKCWEDLDGKYCRIVDPGLGGCVTKIGNLIDDKWFDIKKFFEEANNG